MIDMHDEVVEAVVEHYKGADEDIAADCLVYAATKELEAMNRCPECGSKLESYTHLVYHPEVDEPPCYEPVTEVYCPRCDIKVGGNYV